MANFVNVVATDGTYKIGENLDISVTWDEIVNKTGTTTLTLSNGAAATYQSGEGTATFVFRYTVAEGDTASADLHVSNYLGTITDAEGGAAAAASGDLGSVIIDSVKPTLSFTSIETDNTINNKFGKIGDEVTLKFSSDEALYEIPTVVFIINGGDRTAAVTNTIGNNYKAVYKFVIGDVDSPVTYTIEFADVAGNSGTEVTQATSGFSSGITFDKTDPSFTSVSATDGTYKIGENLDISVTWGEIVKVTGTPTITLSNGAIVNYTSGDGSNTLLFNYLVVEGHASSTDLGVTGYSGTINDRAGNPATAASGDLGNVTVDADAPDFLSVTATDGAYGVGENLDISVTWDEIVNKTGTPTLTLSNGSTATYQSGDGTATLVFRYTVAEGHTASADLGVTGYLGTITDAAGGAAAAVSGNLGNVTVDSDAPDLSSITATDGAYGVGENLYISVTWDENVNKSGTPTLTLSNGATATYQSGDGTATFVFRYTVGGGDTASADLSVSSYSGTITDAAGGAAAAVSGDLGNVIVDSTAPAAAQVGTVTTVGGTVVDNSYNSTNTSLNIVVPIANDSTLTGGSVQLRISVNGGVAYADLSGAYPIVIGNLGTNRTFVINDSGFTSSVSESQTATFAAIITDVAGNSTTLTASTQTIVRDETLPTLGTYAISTNHTNYLNSNYSRVGSIVTLTFVSSETVTSTAIQFQVNGVNSTNNAVVTNSGNNWQATLTLANGDSNGAVIYSISAFTDLAGNVGTTVNSGATEIVFDKTAPTITTANITFASSDVTAASGGQNTTDVSNAMVGDVISLTFTADEDLNFVSGSEPLVTFTTTPDSTSVGGTQTAITNAVSYSQTNATTYVASYTTHSSDIAGDISFNITYEDLAGNESTATMGTTFPSVRFDKTAVTLSSLDVYSNNTNTDYAKTGDVISFLIKTNHRIQSPELTFNAAVIPIGNRIRVSSGTTWDSADEWEITHTVLSTDPSGSLTFSLVLFDLAGNKLTVTQSSISGVGLDSTKNVKIQQSKPTISSLGTGTVNGYTFVTSRPSTVTSLETLKSWDPGATGSDEVEGVLTSSITTSYSWRGTQVNYYIHYNLTNSSGISAYKITRQGTVPSSKSASSFGDPYIIPIYGDIYKLPDLTAAYRLYELDNIFINTSVDKATKEMRGRMLDFYRKLGGDNNDSQEIILNGYYYHNFFISSEGHEFMLDLINNKIIIEEEDKLYFNLSIEEKKENRHILKIGSYVELSISWTTEKYGNMHITIDLYKNPQIDNGIKLLSDINNDSIGLLIKNYDPSTMEIEDIKTLETNTIINKLKNNPSLSSNQIFEVGETLEVFYKK